MEIYHGDTESCHELPLSWHIPYDNIDHVIQLVNRYLVVIPSTRDKPLAHEDISGYVCDLHHHIYLTSDAAEHAIAIAAAANPDTTPDLLFATSLTRLGPSYGFYVTPLQWYALPPLPLLQRHTSMSMVVS
jgi:hypothetical protein